MTPKRRIIPVFVPHLGCPHDCVFCDQRGISGTDSPPDGAGVYTIITNALKKLPHGEAVEAAFYGGSFTAVPEKLQDELLSAAANALALKPGSSIRVSTRPDYVDAETVGRLMSKGVGTIELGAQSMSEHVLAVSARGHTPDNTRRAAGFVREGGAALILQMMTGLPGDTAERSIRTARELAALRPDGVRIYPAVIIRDTRLHSLWLAGKYREHTVREAVLLCAEICDIFDGAGIPVIRLGLNPSEGLSAGGAVAGAYHPAFGELVGAERYLRSARSVLQSAGAETGARVTLCVAPGCISKMTGQRRSNIETLKREFGLGSLTVHENGDVKGKNIVADVEKCCEM